jgi:hypothetical protein
LGQLNGFLTDEDKMKLKMDNFGAGGVASAARQKNAGREK